MTNGADGVRSAYRLPGMSSRLSIACAVTALAAALAAAGCGSSSGSGVKAPTIGAARTFQLQGFEPN